MLIPFLTAKAAGCRWAKPTRIYTGKLPLGLKLAEVPGSYRRRWSRRERVIRELIKGANLNANFGYTYHTVPNRTLQRQWAEAQEQVESSERLVAQHHQAGRNLRQKLRDLAPSYRAQCQALLQTLSPQQTEFLTRQANGQPWRRCQQRLAQTFARLDLTTQRYHLRRDKLLAQLQQRGRQLAQAQADLIQRRQARDALDTASLCRERILEKDQIIRRTISLCLICNCYWPICIIGPVLTSLRRPGNTWN